MSTPQLTTTPWSQLRRELVAAWPVARWSDVGVVIGCSGGADSVALLRAMSAVRDRKTHRGFLVAAHMNHGLRGQESDDDQQFVTALASDLGVELAATKSASTATDEATLRESRLSFLTDVANRCGARYVAVAHTADDNVETMLHHLMRGTGPAGLTGMADHRSLDHDLVLVRPLIHARRRLIRDALVEIQQAWREDSSNDDTRYRRNWIRHQLIPLIESEYPSGCDAIARTIQSLQSWRDTIDRQATAWLNQHAGVLANPPQVQRDTDVDESIAIAAMQQFWTANGWSRASMAHDHWKRLAATLLSTLDQRYHLPGDVDVDATGTVVTFRVSRQPE